MFVGRAKGLSRQDPRRHRPPWDGARLETDHDVDARGAVARTLMDHGILVVGMSRTTATLEDVFLELASDSRHLPPRQDGSPANPQAAASDRADSQEEGR